LDTHAKSLSRPRPVTALDHVGVEEPRAQSLRRLPAARRSGSPRLARAHPKVGEEVPEVERRFRLADGVEVDQTALLAGEEQLRWAEVPVAEARWPGVGPPGVRGCRFEPFMERCTQVGRETLEDEACLGQFDQLVRGRAVRPKRAAGGMEARRDARGRLDRSLQCGRSVGSRSPLQPLPQQPADPGLAGYCLQQRQTEPPYESERAWVAESRRLPFT